MTATLRVTERSLRRDAEANRGRLLAAAATVFADRGLDATVEEIARAAGVGMGTLYRRFPTKDALIEALVRDILDRLVAIATAGLHRPGGIGLEQFLEGSSAAQAAHRGCLPRLWNIGGDDESVRQVRATIATLLDDAKDHGRVRQELTPTDVTMVMWSIRGVIETTGGVAPQAWRRHLDILIAGLRPIGPVLAHGPITRSQVDRVIAQA